MNKALALSLIGGSPLRAAKAVGVSRSAVAQWPDPLPPKLVDRVVAAWARENVPNLPQAFRVGGGPVAQAGATQGASHG